MEELYNQIDFIVSGGALKLLTDFLGSKNLPALVVEPNSPGQPAHGDQGFHVLDAVGIIPESLVIQGSELSVRTQFSNRPPMSAFEIEEAEGNEKWPWIIRMRGSHWEVYLLLARRPEGPLSQELNSYAGLIRLWRTFQRIDDTEQKLSRLSYMILATKSTLASIFEPMPLQYFAAFFMDVLHESLFPQSIVVLKDEGSYLTVFNGKADEVPERKGIYAEPILPPTPIVTRGDGSPFEIVLPVAEGDCRLFCVMTWNELPDSQMLNFLELLGNLAVRALAINNLRAQNQRAASYISTGEFTVLSLSNVLKILKGAKTRSQFLALLVDIFMEQCRMPDCLLAVWDESRQGYALAEKRAGQFKADVEPTLLPSALPVPYDRVHEISYNLDETDNTADAIFRSWGLGGCPWEDVSSMQYLFPICDDNSLVGIIALASDSRIVLDKAQLASLHLIAQFAAYEFRRF